MEKIGIFRRCSRSRDQVMVTRILYQHIHKEESGTPHHRIDLLQIGFIQGIEVMHIEVFAQPGSRRIGGSP